LMIMTHKRIWKRNVDTDIKLSWENQRTGDEVFIMPADLYAPEADKTWTVFYPDKIRGLDMIHWIPFSNKRKAMGFAKKIMAELREKERR
jgi:hypothetical protein